MRPIRNINAIDIKKPGLLASGYIQFVLSGGRHLNSTLSFTGGAFDAAMDENSVVFTSERKYKIALQMKEYIEHYGEHSNVAITFVADEIMKLQQLLEQGIITESEFSAKRKQLMMP